MFLKGLFKQKVLFFILFWFSGGFSSCSPVVGNRPSTKRILVVDVLRQSICLFGICLTVNKQNQEKAPTSVMPEYS